jgi:hypothetical protein
MKTLKHTTVTSNLGKILKSPAIFLLFGLMEFTFLAEGQGIIVQAPRAASNYWKNLIENQPRPCRARPGDFSAEERIYSGPGSEWANRPWRRTGPTYYYVNPAPRVPKYYQKFTPPSYAAPNYTPQVQSGRTLQWKTGAGQQLRLDRLYVGLDANLILKAFGRPDKVSWQYSTWTYQNLNIQNPLTGRQYRNVTFVVKNRKIQVASVH